MKLQKEVLSYFQEMKQFFIRKGKKEKVENAFRTYLWLRARTKKTNFLVNLTKSMLNTTPYIRLRAKKRRRFTKYKLEVVQKNWARKKALGAFSKSFKEHSSNARDFYSAIDKELELVQSGKSNIQAERDDYHKKALKAAPFKWRKLLQRQKSKKQLLLTKERHSAKILPKLEKVVAKLEGKTTKPVKSIIRTKRTKLF